MGIRATGKKVKVLDAIRRHVRGMNDFLRGRDDVAYKIGELNAPADLVADNIYAALHNDRSRLRVVDFELW